MTTVNVLGERMQSQMLRYNLSAPDVAVLTGYHENSVRRVLSTGKTYSDTLVNYAKALRTSVSYLLGEVDYPDDISGFVFKSGYGEVVDIPILDNLQLKFNTSFSLSSFFISDILSSYGESLKCIKYIGDSMSPRYKSGEVLLYTTDLSVLNGYCVVASYCGKLLVRGYSVSADNILLRSVNPSYEDISVSASDANLVVYGRVVASVPCVCVDGGYY